MRQMTPDIGTLHFIGIGGIGMSGIAALLVTLGYDVQGSDLAEGGNIQRLRRADVRVMVGHGAENIKNARGEMPACVVISSAVKDTNPELIAARAAKIPVVRRAEMLAELMRLKSAVAVSGTHGKTTTTSMVGHMMDVAGFDPTVVNGGIVNAYGSNTRFGESQWMVVEADESDGSFTRLPATVAVITNIDPEHLDYYGDFEAVKDAYKRFILNLPFHGYAVMCIDHPVVQSLVAQVADRKVITYGFNPQADVRAQNVRLDANGSVFDVVFAPWLGGDTLRDVPLSMLGQHNVQNCLVALSIAREMGVPVAVMKKALSTFEGVKRRFTKTGEVEGITIIDDYGHHPVEIEAVLKTARMAVKEAGGQVIAVMQPHRYSRLSDLFEEFCRCFNDADHVVITDIYAAGESPMEGVSKESFVQGIKTHGHRSVQALESKSDLARVIADIARPQDFVICLGAGDITAWAASLPEHLTLELNKRRGSAA